MNRIDKSTMCEDETVYRCLQQAFSQRARCVSQELMDRTPDLFRELIVDLLLIISFAKSDPTYTYMRSVVSG